MNKVNLVLPLIVFLFLGCQPLIRGILGLKKARHLNDKEILSAGKEFGISQPEIYKINPTAFWNTTSYFDSIQKKDFYQPLQIKCFNGQHEQTVHLINCNIAPRGFSKLDWNHCGSFDVFPMKAGKCREPEMELPLNTELSFIQNFDNPEPKLIEDQAVIIVYWSRMMHKRTREMLSYINEYRHKFSSENVRYYFVNTDNLYTEESSGQ